MSISSTLEAQTFENPKMSNQWLGPYVQFIEKSGKTYLRFAGGSDFVKGNKTDSFFKMTVGYNF
jgi:hypothetical protein